MKFTVGYHDYSKPQEAIHIQPVTEGPSVDPGTPGYYRVKIGGDLTLFMYEDRLRELGRLCLEAPPLLPKVNAAGATRSEDCAIAQPAAE